MGSTGCCGLEPISLRVPVQMESLGCGISLSMLVYELYEGWVLLVGNIQSITWTSSNHTEVEKTVWNWDILDKFRDISCSTLKMA